MRGAVCSMNLVYMLPPKAFSASNSQVNKARVAMPSLESHWCIYAGPNGVLCGAHASYCPTGTMVKRFCSGFKVIDGMDHSSNIKLSTLKLNEGSSRAGPHHDMPCPLPALVCGQGTSELIEGEWVRRAAGGRLVILDGLFDLSYGPADVVLLDGNILHSITGLRDLPGQGSFPRCAAGKGKRARHELERFSAIVFSDFQREDSMRKEGNYSGMWQESWRHSVHWKV